MTFVDAERWPGRAIEADLAVVGAGAAGLALAREFAESRIRVALIEAGGFAVRRRNQADYRGENIGRTNIATAVSRFRCFGGSTTRWGGQCRPLDPIDFEARPGIALSGWPFDLAHLLPYYRRAQEFCRLGPFGYEGGSGPPLESELLETRVYRFSRPTDFGRFYRDAFRSAGPVTVYLNAALLEIECDGAATRVTGLRLATGSGRPVRVEAGLYVLACGGIENARLLLASDRVRPGGLGNDHDLVGRYFMDHPYVFPGHFEPAGSGFPPADYVIEGYDRGQCVQEMHRAFGLCERIIREERLNGASAYLIRRRRYKTAAAYWSPGGRALLHLIEVLQGRDQTDGRLSRDLATLGRDFPNVMRTAWHRVRGFVGGEKVLAVRVGIEATPCPDSRVTLGARTDRWGMRRVRVQWRLNDADLRGYHRLLEVLRGELARLKLGRLVEHGLRDRDGWPGGMIGGKHHMGTTRMHPDPRQGVVDPDCKVHGIANLYVAGSSVFPTGGYANPTMTIAALAIRLAARLKARLGNPPD